MTAVTKLGQRLVKIGLGRIVPSLEMGARESIRLEVTSPSQGSESRIGGLPNLPADIEWPRRADGVQLAFLAQIDLAALPHVESIALPREGTLFFFYAAEDQPWGFDPADRDGSLVIYVPEAPAAHPLRFPPEDGKAASAFEGYSLTPGTETSLPALMADIIEEFEVSEQEYESYFELVDTFATCHRIGGHPGEIQGSVQLEAQLVSNGIYCGGPNSYKEGEARGLHEGASEWQLLLQLDSHEQAGMVWGDLGRLYFMIHKDALASRSFEKVWTILQCT